MPDDPGHHGARGRRLSQAERHRRTPSNTTRRPWPSETARRPRNRRTPQKQKDEAELQMKIRQLTENDLVTPDRTTDMRRRARARLLAVLAAALLGGAAA
ncbi:MAG: hypothetical protein MZV70_51660 [Desulfobacterales bacterium]|nr:hypothetical protein [Desulfobacterales bacterium]